MKHSPKFVIGAAGIVALGWMVPAMGQQVTPPRPIGSAPTYAPTVNVQPGGPGPAPAFSNPGQPPAAPGTARTAPRGVVLVPHGLVTAIDDVKVPARDAGSLTKIHIKPGKLVETDEVLGEIDNRDTLAKQRIAQGELDAATVQANSKAEIDAAKKGRDVAEAEWRSAAEIKQKNPGAISDTELRRAKFQYDRADAQIQVAETDNRVANQTVLIKQAQLDATAIELGKKKIEAPIQGQIVEVYKHMGEWVQPGDPVLRLVRLDRVRVEGFVYAAEAGRTELEGRPVKVTVYLPGEKQVTVSGRVDYASPIIEGSGRNRQYRIWTEVDNQFVDGNFLIQPGASAELQVDLTAAKLPPTTTGSTTPAEAPPAFGQRSEAPAAATPAVEALKPAVSETIAAPVAAPAPAAPAPMITTPMAPVAPAARPMTVAPAASRATTPAAPAPRTAPLTAQPRS